MFAESEVLLDSPISIATPLKTSEILQPSARVNQKEHSVHWGMKEQAAFACLKTLFTTAPVLAL